MNNSRNRNRKGNESYIKYKPWIYMWTKIDDIHTFYNWKTKGYFIANLNLLYQLDTYMDKTTFQPGSILQSHNEITTIQNHCKFCQYMLMTKVTSLKEHYNSYDAFSLFWIQSLKRFRIQVSQTKFSRQTYHILNILTPISGAQFFRIYCLLNNKSWLPPPPLLYIILKRLQRI